MTAIEKLIKTAESQIGYLEKATNSNLDDFTKNSGYNNWNKYARDFDEKWPSRYNSKKNGYAWCDIFVDWCFVTTFGPDMAWKLLYQPTKSLGAGVNYSRDYYEAAGRLYTRPEVGDQVFFGTKHTGLVVEVNGNQFYTIEGNTSSGDTVVANGGQVARKGPYSILSDRTFGRPNWKLVDGNYSESNTNTDKYTSTQIKYLQQNLTVLGYDCGQPDGDFGAKTKAALLNYEKNHNLTPNGAIDDKDLESIKSIITTLQNDLNSLNYNCGTADGVAGNNTINAIKKFQKDNGLAQDGIAGKNTLAKIEEMKNSRDYLQLGDSGNKVKQLQETLNTLGFNCGTIDGDFGNKTYTQLKTAQTQFGLKNNGIYDTTTKAYLEKNISILGNKKVGIDISVYQKNINLEEAKKEGISFVMIRGGYTSSKGTLNVDNSFAKHYNSAKNLNLPIGIYWYSIAKSEKEVKEEAKFLYENCLKDRSFELPIFLDVENKNQLTVGKEKLTNICNTFIDYLANMNYVAGIYSSASMFKNYMNVDQIKGEIWVAQWNQNYNSNINCGIWQFGGETNKLRNVKINGMICDQDLLNKNYEYIKLEKKNGFGPVKESTVTKPVTAVKSRNLKFGDTGSDVKELQENLNTLGFSCGRADGDFGSQTLKALKYFQKNTDLVADGVAGAKTQYQITKWLEKIYKGTVRVNTGLNIRQEPSVTSKIIGEFRNGNVIQISVVNNGWGKLTDREGWVMLKYVKEN